MKYMKESKKYTVGGLIILVTTIVLSYLYIQIVSVPENFPTGRMFVIQENESLKSISRRLKDAGYIKSPLLFRAGISYLGKDRSIQLGGYMFPTALTLFGVVGTFVNGHPDAPLISATIPEGSTSGEVASLIAKVIPSISIDGFNRFITKYHAEGKLFPSTYFLLPSYTEEDIVKLMVSTFSKKTENIIDPTQIMYPLQNENDVLVLASILEGEAKTEDDMSIVSGILTTRLKREMPLQVDVVKETYKRRGLPLTPINNPGLIAIRAALHPKETDYLFYLTGNDGKMYYAKTFDEHKRNIRKYLK